ncbi:MAG: hypothetical protein ABJE95_17565 [Byssovorax sp.]
MSQAATAAPPAAAPKPAPKKAPTKEERAQTDPKRFALLVAQLVGFTALAYFLEKTYVSLFVVTLIGFCIHYWLPFRAKEPFWFAFSLIGTVVFTAEIAGLKVALVAVALTVVVGLLIYAIFAAPVPYWLRVLGVAVVFGVFIGWGAFGKGIARPPVGFFAVFGSAFSFRIFPYLYEARYFKGKPSLHDFVRYFFMMPGFKLQTVDFQKLGQSFYQRDINVVAQQGMRWIARGALQYTVWTFTHDHVRWITSPRQHPLSALGVLEHLALVYTLYLSVSSRIHVFVGIMHLFGYDLPEPYRWFAFAHSPLDFWRRANIYWKDIMLKIVFMPVYFSFRKRSDTLAKLMAITAVFVTTWFLHIWNDSWKVQLSEPFWKAMYANPQQLLFWGSYGALCAGNLLLEIRAERAAAATPKKRLLPKITPPANLFEAARRYVVERIGAPVGMHPLRVFAQIFALQIVVSALFSLRHAPSTHAWFYTMAFWR